MAQLVHVPIGRAGAVLTLARTAVPGLSSTGERSGAVVIPQCVGGSPGPTESEMSGASSALNQRARALAVPWPWTANSASARCELQSLWVAPRLRGCGLATRLIAAAEAEAAARGCSQTVHFTYAFQARGLYERNGYELVGRVENFPSGTDVLWYRKLLIS